MSHQPKKTFLGHALVQDNNTLRKRPHLPIFPFQSHVMAPTSTPPVLETYSQSHNHQTAVEPVILEGSSNIGQLGGLEVAPGTSIGPSSNVNSPSAISETSVSGLSRTGSDLGSELVPLISSLQMSGSSRNHKDLSIGGIGVGACSGKFILIFFFQFFLK